MNKSPSASRAMVYALLLAIGCLQGSRAAMAQQAPPSVMVIEQALADHAYDRAIAITQAALRSHPDDYRMWTLRGMALADAGRPSAALTAYRRALALMPDFLPALEGAAQIDFQLDRAEAIPFLQHILRLRPADPTTSAMLALLEYKRGDCKDAVRHFWDAQSAISGQFVSVSEYGICLANLDRFDDAITVLRQAVEIDPIGQQSRYNLALTLWRAKRFDKAIQALQPAIDSRMADEQTLRLAADIYEANNETPRAVQALRRAIVMNPRDTSAYVEFAEISSDHNSYQVGIDMLNAGLARMPRNAELYLTRGVLFAQSGNLDNAFDDFEKANRLNPRLSFAGTAEGIVQTQKHDTAQAIAKFREEARLHPTNAFNQYLLAETLAQQGAEPGSSTYREGIRAAGRAVQIDPHLAIAQNLLASLYLQSGETSLAILHCRAVLQFDPDNQEAVYHLILALRKNGHKDEITALTKRLISLRNAARDKRSHVINYQLVDATSQHAAAQ